MTPFYSGDGVTIWQGDARALPLADESVHLIVTSPPYNARINYDVYEDWLPWEDYWHGLIEPSLRECYRVLVHGGRIAINIANVVRKNVPDGHQSDIRYLSQDGRKWKPAGAGSEVWAKLVAPSLWPLLREIGFLEREQITWVKAASPEDSVSGSTAWGSYLSAQNPVLRAIGEPVFIACKGAFAREPGVSDIDRAEFMAWTRNVWNIQTGHHGEHLGHPATFPLGLPRRLIKLYSYVGDTVLDPFMGSGTTLRAAKDTGRIGLGVELSERYCRLAASRCAQSVMPLEVP